MAQAYQQTQGRDAISNVSYDLVTSLSEDLDAVDVLSTYIEDCNRAGDQELANIFNQIRQDEMRHCDMLKKAIEDRCKQGKFR